MDDAVRGLFATRAPRRPNPIGLSVVRLVRIEGAVLHIEDVDVLDGTPLLDLKPYVPQFDAPEGAHIGWLTGNVTQVDTKRADERFEDS
jgi:tRNA (Thr-GGU) A37 N-methylase